jgi:hypothetical protein
MKLTSCAGAPDKARTSKIAKALEGMQGAVPEMGFISRRVLCILTML